MELFEPLRNLFLDVFLFFIVELATTNFFPGPRCSKTVLFSSQAIILVLCISLMYIHHIAYILVLITLVILIRACVIWWTQKSKENVYLSKPLQVVPQATSHEHVGFRNSRPGLREQFHQTPSSRSPLRFPEHSFPGRSVQHRHSKSLPPLAPPSPQTERIQRKSPPVVNLQTRPSLQRPPINSINEKSTTMSLPTKRPGLFSSYKTHPTLSYFGSMFDFGKGLNVCPPGLVNSGNTCFVNSILQCLAWTPGFHDSLTLLIESNDDQSVFFAALNRLFDQCHVLPDGISRYKPVVTSDLLELLSEMAPHLVTRRNGFSYQSQQDSAEFLLWFLNHIHSVLSISASSSDIAALTSSKQSCTSELREMKSSNQLFKDKLFKYSDIDWTLYKMRANSTIYNQFLGQLLEARECQLCNKVSSNIEYFMVLPIPLPTATHSKKIHSLSDCFSLFSQVEDLVQTNMITCSCILPNEESLTPGKRRALVSKQPKNLIIQLSRYSYDASIQSTVKNKVNVQFPIVLSLPNTLESELGAQGTSSQDRVVYHLVGVCVHSGADSTSHGHYVAYCKTGNKWCYYNDDTVEIISDIEEEIKRYFVLQNAYLLFYSS